MIHAPLWRIDQTMILTRRELAHVLGDLRRRSRRSTNTRLNLVVIRLACCCGLRASEITELRLQDVVVGVERPHLRIGAAGAKRAAGAAPCRSGGTRER